MPTISMPARLAFAFSVSTPDGVAGSGSADGVAAALAKGLNRARWLMRSDNTETRKHVDVVVEVLCSECSGRKSVRGKRLGAFVPCKGCKGGELTHPISGPLALRFRVHREGYVAVDGDTFCACTERSAAGSLCPRCGLGVVEPTT